MSTLPNNRSGPHPYRGKLREASSLPSILEKEWTGSPFAIGKQDRVTEAITAVMTGETVAREFYGEGRGETVEAFTEFCAAFACTGEIVPQLPPPKKASKGRLDARALKHSFEEHTWDQGRRALIDLAKDSTSDVVRFVDRLLNTLHPMALRGNLPSVQIKGNGIKVRATSDTATLQPIRDAIRAYCQGGTPNKMDDYWKLALCLLLSPESVTAALELAFIDRLQFRAAFETVLALWVKADAKGSVWRARDYIAANSNRVLRSISDKGLADEMGRVMKRIGRPEYKSASDASRALRRILKECGLPTRSVLNRKPPRAAK